MRAIRCELCDAPARWLVEPADGRPAAPCAAHRHAPLGRYELRPLAELAPHGPERLGIILARILAPCRPRAPRIQ